MADVGVNHNALDLPVRSETPLSLYEAMAGGSNLTMCYSSVDALRSDSEDQEHLPGRVILKDE